jgi:hypothetical protein
MLSLESQLQALLKPRTNPPVMSVTTGTGVDKFVHALNTTGLHGKYDIAVRRQWHTQLGTELLKLSGEHSVQRFLHSVRMFADWNEDDFAILGKELSPTLMNDTDKIWMSMDRDSITSQLDLFFDPKSSLYLIDVLNGAITDVVNKYKKEPVGYNLQDYNDRKRIGVWLQLPVSDTNTVNRLETEILRDYFKSRGFALMVVHAEELRESGFDGKSDLNKFINSRFDVLDNAEIYPNGIVAVHPNWGYAARSMTESRLDIALNLRNSVNTQDDDRVMSNGKTLDGKKKLIGLKIEAGFKRSSADWEYRQSEYLRQLFNEQRNEDSETTPLGPWLRGVNIFKRVPQTTPTLVTERELGNDISDSDRVFQDVITRVNLKSNLWTKTDILSKLHIVRGNNKVSKLIDKVKKRVNNGGKKSTTPPITKTEEQKIKELYVQIMYSLIGWTDRIKGYAASRGFTTIEQTLESIKQSEQLDSQMAATLGISASEYIELLQVEGGLPVNDMDFMFNAKISETV